MALLINKELKLELGLALGLVLEFLCSSISIIMFPANKEPIFWHKNKSSDIESSFCNFWESCTLHCTTINHQKHLHLAFSVDFQKNIFKNVGKRKNSYLLIFICEISEASRGQCKVDLVVVQGRLHLPIQVQCVVFPMCTQRGGSWEGRGRIAGVNSGTDTIQGNSVKKPLRMPAAGKNKHIAQKNVYWQCEK